MTDTHLDAKNVSSVAESERSDERTEPLMGSDDRIKLSDMNQLCLEHIFMHLDLGDLLNVAHANKYLGLATINPFSKKYGQKLIILSLTETPTRCRGKANAIWIQDLRTILQALRCFGQSIINLETFYDYHEYEHKKYHRMMGYVNEFCAESLTKFTFHPALGFEQLTKPFGNVEEIRISQIRLQEKCLSRVFPKLRYLLEYELGMFKEFSSVIVDHFPNLQYIKTDLTTNGVHFWVDALRLNSHVKSLRIQIPSFRFLEEIKDHLQSLVNLDIRIYNDSTEQSWRLKSNLIHFPNIKRFSIHIDSWGSIPLPKLPFQFGQLKEFTLDGNLKYNDFYNDFLVANPNIEKLTLNYDYLDGVNSVTDPKKLQKMLPSLKEISLCKSHYHIDDIVQHWTNDLKTVNRFNFPRADTLQQIKKLVLSEWHIIVSVSGINLYSKIVTLERIEALTHDTPFSLSDSSCQMFHPKNKFLFCNCKKSGQTKSM